MLKKAFSAFCYATVLRHVLRFHIAANDQVKTKLFFSAVNIIIIDVILYFTKDVLY